MVDKRKSHKQSITKQLKIVETGLKDGIFVFAGPLSIGELANTTNKKVNDIITYFFQQGKMFNINHILDEEQIAELCIKWGYDFQKENEVNASNFMEQIKVETHMDKLQERSPIITIMGHVDHGKTTLIDQIRHSNILATENGGITQHTGAYQVEYNKKKITFLDTPGHEAFTAMRARGAKVTDIVVLVVAADDGVMPQTKEAITHAKAGQVPIIVFVNKMDKQAKDLEKLRGDLAKLDVVDEKWGGDIQFIYGSALKNEGIEQLFEAINLQSEMLELKANYDQLAIGTVIESKLDKGKGSMATLVVLDGTLFKRDFIVAGSMYGRIRSMHNSFNQEITKALPGDPVIITGLNYTPNAGDRFFGFKDEKFAKDLANKKAFKDKQEDLKMKQDIQIEDGKKVLNLIIKADVQGTAQAVKHALTKLENDEVRVRVISASVGSINKSDILLAQASKALIYGFNIRANSSIKQFAEQSAVMIKSFSIIYKMTEDIEALIKGMKAPKYEEKVIGEAQISKVIYSSKVGNIAGSMVIEGVIRIDAKVRLIRDGKTIYNGVLDSLQREANATKEVQKGKEFGAHIKNYNDIKEGDIIEAYLDIEVKN